MRRALLLAGFLIVSACSGDGADTAASTTVTPASGPASTTTAPPPEATSTATTTTQAPPTTVEVPARPEVLVSDVNRDSIDDFDTTGENAFYIAMELRDLFVFLEGNPTSSADEMVSLLFEPGYPYWDRITVGFLELTDNPGWRYTDPGVETLGIEVVASENRTAVVRVADLRETQIISNASGQLVKTYDGWNRRVSEFTLRRGTDGLWRYADALPSEPISDEELATMVPVEWTGRQP